MDRRVLVTGHTGFKGAWLAAMLSRLGARVTGVALDPEVGALYTRADLAELTTDRRGDIRDCQTVADAMQACQPSVVLHLAAQALVRESYADPLATYATNVMGTAHVLDAARRQPGIEAVVVVTTDKVYENHEELLPYEESEPLGGHDPYSSSKACAEILTASYRRSFFADAPGATGCRIATARAGNVIGGGDVARDRLVPDLLRSLVAGEAVPIRNAHAIRPWQHVLDPLYGYLLLAEALCTRGAAVESAWNFGPDAQDVTPVSTLADQLIAAWGEGSWIDGSDPNAPHEAGVLTLDSSKARRELGWRPALHLDEALHWIVDWQRAAVRCDSIRKTTMKQIDTYLERV